MKFIEYLSGAEAQKEFAQANYEYPVKEGIEVDNLLKSWGTFKSDTLSFSLLGKFNKRAVQIFDEVGWN